MSLKETQLAQKRENGVGNVILYAKPLNKIVVVRTIVVCNTSGVDRTFRLFSDAAGVPTFDESTALYWNFPITAAIPTKEIDLFLALSKQSTGGAVHTLGCQSSLANALTFTVFGTEIE